MKNTKNNLIIFGILVVLAFALGIIALLPGEANAGGFDVRNPRPTIHSLNPNPIYWGDEDVVVHVYGNNFVPGSVVKINNSDRSTTYLNSKELRVFLVDSDTLRISDAVVTVDNPSPGGGRSNSIILKITREFEVATAPATVAASTTPNTGNVQGATTTTVVKKPVATAKKPVAETKDVDALTANALFGANGFFPTSLIGWLILAILILLLVLVFRKMFREDKYHQTPLKHA